MTPVSQVSDEVSKQLLQICCRNSSRAAIPLLLAIALTWFLLLGKVDTYLLQVWSLSSAAVILLRVIALPIITQHAGISALQKRMGATALTLLLGCTIASVLYFFPATDVFERAMLTAILLGLCTVSYSTNFGYGPLLLAYIGPLLGTLSILWFFNSDPQLHPLLKTSVGVSILIVAHTLLRNGKFMFEVFALSIESSRQLEVQSADLSSALKNAETAKLEAETSSQSKTRFIAAASHDLRQPVHVLNLFGAALKNSKLDDRSRDIVDNMNIAVTSLSSQLNALLDISELDSGAVKPDITSVDLSLLINNLQLEMSKLAEDKGIQLLSDIPEGEFVRTDPAMFSQIVRNLCGNAIKYTYSGHVRLSTSKKGNHLELRIADTGIGIKDADCNKVFEEFYQVSNSGRNKVHGMGLGLSIVERLVKQLGHTLELDSHIGQGTTVTIALERCTQDQISTARAPLMSEDTTITLPEGYWVHILDDEESVQKSVQMFLQSIGCKTTTTASSSDTIAFLESSRPDAVLIDLRLQNNDSGLTVVEWINTHRAGLPMALITGESLSDGALASSHPELLTLQKPVSNAALIELLDYMVIHSIEAEPVNNNEPTATK